MNDFTIFVYIELLKLINRQSRRRLVVLLNIPEPCTINETNLWRIDTKVRTKFIVKEALREDLWGVISVRDNTQVSCV